MSSLTEEARWLTLTVDELTKSVEVLIESLGMMFGNVDMLKEIVFLLAGNINKFKESVDNFSTRIRTTEAAMTLEPPSPFLSLPPEVVLRLLSFVDTRDVGLKSILNMRQTCTVTKGWVDSVETGAEEMLSKCQAKVNLTWGSSRGQSPLETLQRFVQSPPPVHVTSLCLLGVNKLSGNQLSIKEIQLWTQFVSFWTPKLESLEVDCFDSLLNPVDSRVNELLCSPSLRRLYCHKLEHEVQSSTRTSLELPQSLFQLESISIGTFNLDSSQARKFFSSLSANQHLRRLEMTLKDYNVMEEITEFIDRKRLKVNLEIRLTLSSRISNVQDKKLFQSFVSSVVASLSSIRLLDVTDALLTFVGTRMREEVSTKFFKCVERISTVEGFEAEESKREKRLLKFPNLKRIDLLRNFYGNMNSVFPEGLERLGVFRGIPRNLPSSLTHLDVREYCCSLRELERSLTLVDLRCPRLHTLRLTWRNKRCAESYDLMTASASSKTPFKALRSLTFVVCIENPPLSVVIEPLIQEILVNRMKLPQLNLLHLSLQFALTVNQSQLSPVLDSTSIRSFSEGNISNSLVCLDIGTFFVSEKARKRLATLQSTVAKNKKKRRQMFGSKWDEFLEWLK